MFLRLAGTFELISTVLAMQLSGAAALLVCMLASLTAFALLVGLVTTVAALVACGFALLSLLRLPLAEVWALHLCVFIALALMGPGAISVDARLHGRRVVHLQARAPDEE
ncbi:hypothetical protein [Stenotrophomonas oahuensis]|uniref:DoxX family protein n=1 Tax=Stenotrophomonas oahuensis TaxID=3003271 RepID=A0ABY9YN48_9GAMM|nr:hypothetical protein [Stenotrophomonas sp. A5586]WNH52143.1 hypothetical protein PDM29_17660 [Stenotrophomonas sp. A5586]